MELGNIDPELLKLARRLNLKDTLPQTALERNSLFYPLVTYVNHTIALSLSGSYDAVALFISRADKELNILIGKNKADEVYLPLCQKYLSMLSNHLIKHALLGEQGVSMLPDKYLDEL
ncbi:hypothetical protein B5M42_017200 [Paenibacillus athensensis]|uniref:Uncharacterized protein n=1 Tax=Paenibacillus athensensis TaxID=1967502 RepID=A0A4Y8PTE7_9BACL|nr:hypothetical protein [Paenibacillus athensensis]MCD1260541.1 hypothetical protein [Paenibacillus athensensis]